MLPFICSCAKDEDKDLDVITVAMGGFKFCGELFLDKKSFRESDSPDARHEAGD